MKIVLAPINHKQTFKKRLKTIIDRKYREKVLGLK